MPEDVHKEYIPIECHYFGHKRCPYDLDLQAFVEENSGGGGGGVTIYTGDGALSGERTVELDGHILSFKDAFANNQLIIDPIGSTSGLVSGDGTNSASISLNGSSTPSFNLETQNGVNDVSINGDSDDDLMVYTAGTQKFDGNVGVGVTPEFLFHVSNGDDMFVIDGDNNTMEYTADTHTFNGVINLPVQAAPASPNDGDVWRESNTNTGLKIRVNGVTKTISVT